MSEWQKVPLSKLLTESKVESENPSAAKRIRVRLNVNGVEQRPYTNTNAGATKYYTRKAGQFIYGRQNLHKGAFGVVPKELDGFESSSDIPAFDVSDDCFPEWIELFLKQGNYYLSLDKIATGVGSRRISPKKFLALEIPLPPKETQKEISEKVSALTQKHFSLLSELNHQADLLKKLRQRILQEAIEGKLTAAWRAANPDVEPASALLERIQAEKAQLIAEKKIRKQKELPPISKDEIPFELPQGWEWVRLQNISTKISDGPFGSHLKTKDYVDDGVRVIRLENVGILEFKDEKKSFVTEEKYEQINNHTVSAGDIIFSSFMSDEVRVTVLPQHINKAINKADCFCVRTNDAFVNRELIVYFLSAHATYQQLTKDIHGATRPRINTKQLKKSFVPFPPLAEQKAIVAKVEKLLAVCDQLEGEVTKNQENAEKLMQAVLREAFSSTAR